MRNQYKFNLIGTGSNTPMIDSVELGVTRDDGIPRLYTTREWNNSSGYEYTLSGSDWGMIETFKASAYCSSPVIADLKKEKNNSLFLGGWNGAGILMIKFKNDSPDPMILPGSTGKGNILAMLSGDGRNDGKSRLYVAHWSQDGLIEYSWNGQNYISKQIFKKSLGRFAIGKGRNDKTNRIYFVERGGTALHELSWDGLCFTDKIIFNGNTVSNGSVFVSDGRGDGINRLYVWAGSLFELTYKDGQWKSLLLDESNIERYYITAGSIRKDNKPGVYVSVKKKGLYEYVWSKTKKKYDLDVITGATGGCVIGDGRGDGNNRLYVARGTKGYFTKAAIVEIWEETEK